jgi:hypothetical protein
MTSIEKEGALKRALQVGCACVGWFCLAATAWGAPTDFRVLTDELTEKGEFALELQSSMARLRAKPGAATLRAQQGLAEFSYGLAPHWELSLQLPASRVSGTTYGNGANIELTYSAPHDAESGLYWGGRVESGRARPIGDPATWETEWRPILGYRRGDWHAVLNAGLTAALTGEERQVNFEPSAKLAYRAARSLSVGLEYYLAAGPLSHPRPRGERQELGLLVLDAKVGEFDVNFGVGKGLTSGSDKAALKLLLSWAPD